MPLTRASINDQAAAWVARMYAAPTDADRTAFAAWHDADSRHAGAYLRAEAAWTLLDRAQVLAHGDGLAVQQQTSASVRRHNVGRTRRYVMGGAMAAAVSGALAVGVTLAQRLSLTTARGELRNVPLRDHSVATVNTDSHIDVALSDHLRSINLVKGEAWFEVAKNPHAPFVVSAGDVRVRAVGTAFSVRRHAGGADVLVTEGVVEAWNVRDTTQRITLKAGGEAYVPQTPAPVAVVYRPEEVVRKLAWRDREIILKSTALGDAVAEFNRYNDREIIIADPALNRAQLVGGFQVDQPDSFARAVHMALDVPVSIRDDRIIIGTAPGNSSL